MSQILSIILYPKKAYKYSLLFLNFKINKFCKKYNEGTNVEEGNNDFNW